MKRKIILTLAFLLIALSAFSLIHVHPVFAAPVTVSTTTFAAPVYLSWQHKMFYANGRYWIFRSNSTYMVYDHSTDGVTWTTNQPLAGIVACDDSCRFSVYTNGTHVVYARWNPTILTTYFRQGTCNSDGTISWDGAEQTIVTDVAYTFGYVNIAIDNQGFTWVSGTWFSGANWAVRVYKNSKTDGTWTTAGGFPATLQVPTYADACASIILPLTSAGQVTVVYVCGVNANNGTLTARRWTGAAWTDGFNATNLVRRSTNYGQFDAVAENDTVHVAYVLYVTTPSASNKLFYYQFSGDTWSGGTSVSSVDVFSLSSPNLAYEYNNKALYVFYHSKSATGNITANHMYYRLRVNGVWADQVDWIDESADGFTANGARANSFWVQAQNSTHRWIAVAYGTCAASPYNLRFAQIVWSRYPTIGSPTVAWDDADNCYAQKKDYSIQVTYSDADGGFLDINFCEMFLKTGANATRAEFAFAEDTSTFSTVSGSTEWTMTGLNTSSGNNIAITWNIKAQWDATEESDLDLLFFVNNTAGLSSNSLYDANFDVVTRLVTSGLASNDSRTDIGGGVAISGTVYYADDPASNTASTSYPPDAEFTSVSIHNSTHVIVGTDTTIVNGAFSASFNIPNAVQSNTYHVFLNMTDADYSDADALDGDTVAVIGDSLTTFNVQPVQYQGSGAFFYQAQIEWAYDNVTISGATVGAAYPNGSSIGTATSNSTGWATFIINQSNATNGIFSIYGVNDNNYTITTTFSNATFTLYDWALTTSDIAGSGLSNTNLGIGVGATTVWNGTQRTLYVPGDTFAVSITWLTLPVNTTASVTVSGATSTDFNCTVYPILTTSYHYASNTTISSTSYASNVLTISFSGATSTYILAVDNPTVPTFILNATYNYAAHFTPYGYLVLPHYGNATLTVSYESFSSIYLQKTTHKFLTVTFASKILSITATGTSGDIGTIEVYCGTWGNPVSTTGWIATSYSSTLSVLTGTFTFASDKTVTLTWMTTGGGSTGGGPGGPAIQPLMATVILSFPVRNTLGTTINAFINITWTGVSTVTVQEIFIDLAPFNSWQLLVPDGLPQQLVLSGTMGTATIPITLTIPEDVEPGTYVVPCIVSFGWQEGAGTKTFRTVSTLEIVLPLPTVPDLMTYWWVFMFAALAIGMLVFRSKRRR